MSVHFYTCKDTNNETILHKLEKGYCTNSIAYTGIEIFEETLEEALGLGVLSERRLQRLHLEPTNILFGREKKNQTHTASFQRG